MKKERIKVSYCDNFESGTRCENCPLCETRKEPQKALPCYYKTVKMPVQYFVSIGNGYSL